VRDVPGSGALRRHITCARPCWIVRDTPKQVGGHGLIHKATEGSLPWPRGGFAGRAVPGLAQAGLSHTIWALARGRRGRSLITEAFSARGCSSQGRRDWSPAALARLAPDVRGAKLAWVVFFFPLRWCSAGHKNGRAGGALVSCGNGSDPELVESAARRGWASQAGGSNESSYALHQSLPCGHGVYGISQTAPRAFAGAQWSADQVATERQRRRGRGRRPV